MKKSFLFAGLIHLTVVFSWVSCKEVVETELDCTFESAYLSLKYQVDESNPLLVDFTFVNKDTVDNRFTLDPEIKWDFGDGSPETTQGLQISHTYSDAGSYDVKAYYTLRKGSTTCTSSKNKTINLTQ